MIQTVVRRAGVRIWRPLTELQSFSPALHESFQLSPLLPCLEPFSLSWNSDWLMDSVCLLSSSHLPHHCSTPEAWSTSLLERLGFENSHCLLGRVGSFPWVPISFDAFYLGSILSHFALSSLCGCPHQSFRLIVELHRIVQAYQKLHYLPGVMWALGQEEKLSRTTPTLTIAPQDVMVTG